MTDMVFEFYYLIMFISGFCIIFGVGGGFLEKIYKYCPAFRKWTDNLIGLEDEESEVGYE